VSTRRHLDALPERELVDITECALTILHARYTDERTLLGRFSEAAADDVRLAIEDARGSFDRFLDHYREQDL
jgi:hypothetical protein